MPEFYKFFQIMFKYVLFDNRYGIDYFISRCNNFANAENHKKIKYQNWSKYECT